MANIMELGLKTSPEDERGDTHLHRAVRDNYPVVVDLLLEDLVTRPERDLDTQNRKGQTALHIACLRGAEIIVRSLLDHGARTDLVDEFGDTPLHDAAVKNYPEIVKLLLVRPETKKAILNTQNCKGQTALHAACLKGAEDVVEILIDLGANTGLVDSDGDTAFYYAVKQKNAQVVNHLLEDLIYHSVDLSTKYKTGKTVLHYACKFGLESVVKKMLEVGVKTDVVDEYGSIALYYAVKKNHTTIAQLFLDHLTEQPVHLGFKSKQSITVLHYACFNGMEPVVNKLLELGVATNVKDIGGETPLHYAVLGDQLAVVELLLENQNNNKQEVDINMTDNKGQTALHMACKRGNKLVVKTLLENGAKTDLEQENGDTAIDITMDLLDNLNEDDQDYKQAKKRHLQVVMLLIDNMTSVLSNLNNQYKEGKTAVHYACKFGLEAMVERLLESGARMEFVDDEGDTALHEAARENPAVVNLLLKFDKELVNTANKNGRTALHFASFYGAVDVVKSLLASDAKSDMVDMWGDSPLHDAVGRNHPEVVELILGSQGINIDIPNKNGQTPLHIACLKGAVAVVKVLLDRGASADLLDKRGQTPLNNALRKNHPDIVEILSRGKGSNAELTSNLVAIRNHREIVRFIIEEVDSESWKHEGHILLNSAAERKDKEMMALLVEKGVQDDNVNDDCDGTSDSEVDSDEDSDEDSEEDDAVCIFPHGRTDIVHRKYVARKKTA